MPDNQQLAQPRPTPTPVTEPSEGQVNAGKLSFKIVRIISLIDWLSVQKSPEKTGLEMAVKVKTVKLGELVELGSPQLISKFNQFNYFNKKRLNGQGA